MSTWPASLPGIRIPVTDQPQDQTLRTSMDSGPDKVRRRFSAGVRNQTMPMRLKGSQLDVLEDFYFDTLKGGSLSFDMENPKGGTSSYRFTAPPTSVMVTGSDDPDNRIYNVQLNVEVLP